MAATPKPATKEEVRARYHGFDDHARSMGFEAAWIGLQGVAIALLAVIGPLAPLGPVVQTIAIAFGIAVIAAAIGTVRAADWSRWVGGVASLLLGAVAFALPYVRTDGAEPMKSKYGFVVVALITGVYMLLPSTREAFCKAREVRDRVHAVRREA